MDNEWMYRPPILVGEKIIWHGGTSGFGCDLNVNQGVYYGIVRWIGRIPEIGLNLVAGVEMAEPLKCGNDGAWQTRHMFSCKPSHGLFLPIEKLTKENIKSPKPLQLNMKSAQEKIVEDHKSVCKEGSKLKSSKASCLLKTKGESVLKPSPDVQMLSSKSKGGLNGIEEDVGSGQREKTEQKSKDHSMGSAVASPGNSLGKKKETKIVQSKKNVFNSLSRKDKSISGMFQDQQNLDEKSKLQRSGFLNIFKWFSRKETKHVVAINGNCTGSATSLVSDSSSVTFLPIRHSQSADNADSMALAHKGSLNTPNIMENSYKKSHSSNPSIQETKPARRNSTVSTRSNTSNLSEISSSKPRKRPAPHPPGSPKLSQNCSGKSGTKIGNFCGQETSTGDEMNAPIEKASNESPIYCRVKRKAPQPPINLQSNLLEKVKSNDGSSQNSKEGSVRPLSTFSNFSFMSLSGSSTLKSSTCSENETLTLKSDTSGSSAFPLPKAAKEPLSPKPWYKRKKIIKSAKEKGNKFSKKEKDVIYDSWMPDIQYARQRLNLESGSESTAAAASDNYKDKTFLDDKRLSILSSISDLDRAATEQLQREKAQRKAAKAEYDQAFYNVSSPHILSQEDLLPNTQIKKNETSDFIPNHDAAYDNVLYNGSTFTIPISYSKQPTLKLLDSSLSESNIPSAPDLSLIEESLFNSDIMTLCDGNSKINYEEYLEEIRKEIEEISDGNHSQPASRSTPLQRASFDPELFYQLAKDAKVTCESKFTNLQKDKEKVNKPVMCLEGLESCSFDYRRSPQHRRLPPKNFGLRMNNFFTPDVSTILEGTESVTSSTATTTPAEDIGEDFLNHSSLNVDPRIDMLSLNSDMTSEWRMNTFDLQEIIESFAADLQRDGQNTPQKPKGSPTAKTKADQIREEGLLLREKDNFLLWQKTMQEADLNKDDDFRNQERKKKWACDSCTLINQPWRLHCEACGSLRAPFPKRVEQDDILNSDNASSHKTASDKSPVTVIHDDRVPIDFHNQEEISDRNNETAGTPNACTPNANWETELQSYFTQFDGHANNVTQTGIRSNEPKFRADSNVNGKNNAAHSSRLNAPDGRSQVGGDIKGAKPKQRNVVNENHRSTSQNASEPVNINKGEMDMQQIRRARILKFEQSSFEDQQEYQGESTAEYQQMVNGAEDRNNESGGTSPPTDRVYKKLYDANSVFNNNDQKLFFKNEYKKTPVVMPSGAVKSAVSIFNQLDQLNHVVQVEKPPPSKVPRRRSISNIQNILEFEKLINRNEKSDSTLIPRTASPVLVDVDIASAISKFDEMAAMAEIDRINKPAPMVTKKRPLQENNQKNLAMPETRKNNGNAVSMGNSDHALENNIPFKSKVTSNENLKLEEKPQINLEGKVSATLNSNPQANEVDSEIIKRNCELRAEKRDSCDSIIRDGILYTSGESRRRRSMSIGSGTFELINAKDFASIEAHHSRRPSLNDEFDTPNLSELSHPMLMPEIRINNNELLLEKSAVPLSSYKYAQSEMSGKKNTDIERLSRQLTEAEGIAIFKETLKADEPQLSMMNTMAINRTLKQLEMAISHGKHAQAAKLAEDLAKLHLSCSVVRSSSKKLSAEDRGVETAYRHGHAGGKIESENLVMNSAVKPKEKKMHLLANTTEPNRKNEKLGGRKTNNIIDGTNKSKPDGNKVANVVRRLIKVDPSRREVKSDITNQAVKHNEPDSIEENKPFNVLMFVEDKASHEGPIIIDVQSSMTVGILKLKVEEEFGFPVEVQRWILGRLLADEDSKTLADHKVTAEGCPIFLYLVAPEVEKKFVAQKSSNPPPTHKTRDNEAIANESFIGDPHPRKSILNIKGHFHEKGNSGKGRSEGHSVEVKKVKGGYLGNSVTSKNVSNQVMLNVSKSNHPPPVAAVKNGDKHLREGVKHKLQKRDTNHAKEKRKFPPRKLPTEEAAPVTKQIDHSSKHININSPTVASVQPQPPSLVNGWTCPQCTLINHRERPGCEACATERPEEFSSNGQSSNMRINLRQAVTDLDDQGCVPNLEPFECLVCLIEFGTKEGVVLRDCLHVFCRECLAHAVRYSDTAEVKCPFRNKKYSCQFSLQEREIKDLLSDEAYKKHLDKSVKEAAGSMQNVFYCKTPDCKSFCQYEDNVNVFNCDVCQKANCLTCQVQHEGVTCKQYQDDIANKQDEDALKTKKFFDEIIRRGDGIPCPQCSVMLVRKWGCDWMRCPMCRTEICWVTKGPRWGPEGQGDISGGCKCGINGRKCHPKCTYCH